MFEFGSTRACMAWLNALGSIQILILLVSGFVTSTMGLTHSVASWTGGGGGE